MVQLGMDDDLLNIINFLKSLAN